MQSTAKKRIVRTARSLHIAAWAGAIACVAVNVAAVLTPPHTRAVFVATLPYTYLPRAWDAGITLVLSLICATALIELALMLRQMREDALFGAAVVRHFRRFAGWLVLAAAWRVVMPPLATLVLAMLQDHHHGHLVLHGGGVLALLLTVVFFLVARLFGEAARLEDDSHSIV